MILMRPMLSLSASILIYCTAMIAHAEIPQSQLVSLQQIKELMDSGQMAVAEESLNGLIDDSRTHPQMRVVAMQHLGYLKVQNGDLHGATDAYKRAANLSLINQRDYRDSNKFAAQLSNKIGEYEQAVEYVDRYIASIDPRPADLAMQADIYRKAGNTRGSMEIIQRALSMAEEEGIEPELNWWSTLTLVAQDQGDGPVVALAFDKVLELDPSESFALAAARFSLLRYDSEFLADQIQKYVMLFPDERVSPLQAAVAARDIQAVVNEAQDSAQRESGGDLLFTPLQLAAVLGYQEIVTALLDSGANIDARSENGYTAIENAAKFNQVQAVEQLWSAGANVSESSVLPTLASFGQIALIRKIIEARPEMLTQYNDDLILAASYEGEVETVRGLIEMGARVHGETHRDATFLQAAVVKGHADTASVLLQTGAPPDADGSESSNNPPIRLAVKNGHMEILDMLIEANADVSFRDPNGMSLLHWAAENGSVEIMQTLLDAGVTVNQVDNDGMTPLLIAAIEGFDDVVRQLVAAGADVNHRINEEFTPLTLTARHGSAETLKFLLDEGAEFRDEAELDRALRWAIRDGSLQTVEALLALGANTDGKEYSENNALSLAVIERRVDVARVLLTTDVEVVEPASFLDDWTTRDVTKFLKRNGFVRTKKGRIEEWTLTNGNYSDTVAVRKHKSYYTIAGLLDIINQSGISLFLWMQAG